MDNVDVYNVMFECQFRKMNYTPTGQFYRYLHRPTVSAADIIQDVQSTDPGKKFYGFVCCDIYSPDHVIERFKDLGFPFIFRNIEIGEEHLSPTAEMVSRGLNSKFPKRQLCVTYHADEILLNTDLLAYYLSIGLEVSNVHYAMEYIPVPVFDNFVEKMTKMRIDATYEQRSDDPLTRLGGDTKQSLAKMMLNSSYGRLAMNLEKREQVIYCRQKDLPKHCNNVLFKRHTALKTEYELDLFEVVKKKRIQVDSLPVICGLTILQLAKLHMLRFIHFLHDCLQPGSFTLLYSFG